MQYATHTSHDFFKICARTVGNLDLKHIWKALIQSKIEFLSFEIAKEITFAENLWADKEVKDVYAQMEELDNEAKLMAKNMPKESIEIDTERFNTTSIKS